MMQIFNSEDTRTGLSLQDEQLTLKSLAFEDILTTDFIKFNKNSSTSALGYWLSDVYVSVFDLLIKLQAYSYKICEKNTFPSETTAETLLCCITHAYFLVLFSYIVSGISLKVTC